MTPKTRVMAIIQCAQKTAGAKGIYLTDYFKKGKTITHKPCHWDKIS